MTTGVCIHCNKRVRAVDRVEVRSRHWRTKEPVVVALMHKACAETSRMTLHQDAPETQQNASGSSKG